MELGGTFMTEQRNQLSVQKCQGRNSDGRIKLKIIPKRLMMSDQ